MFRPMIIEDVRDIRCRKCLKRATEHCTDKDFIDSLTDGTLVSWLCSDCHNQNKKDKEKRKCPTCGK